MRVISPSGLGLHLLCCLISYVPHPVTKPKRLATRAGTAIKISGLKSLGGSASSPLRQRRPRSSGRGRRVTTARGSGRTPSIVGHGGARLFPPHTGYECVSSRYESPVRSSPKCGTTGYPFPPSVGEIMNDPVVVDCLNRAWKESRYGEKNRREVGGWVYQDKEGRLHVWLLDFDSGTSGSLPDHDDPPSRLIPSIVGLIHTHPNPTSPRWNFCPSPEDKSLAFRLQVPGLVKTDKGIIPYGPEMGRWGKGTEGCPGSKSGGKYESEVRRLRDMCPYNSPSGL